MQLSRLGLITDPTQPTNYELISATVHRGPGFAVVMQDDAIIPNGEDITPRATPHLLDTIVRAAVHRRPGLAVIVQDRAVQPRDEDIAL
jgi:hypothetical protein